MQHATTLRVGEAAVTMLNAGDLRWAMAQEMSVPEAEWRPRYADLFEQASACPSYSVLIDLADVKTLVDIGDYRATVPSDPEYALKDYTPPPDIPSQLAALGVAPTDVSHVVITHNHWDHFAGVTHASEADNPPTFPNARYYLGAADWADAGTQEALMDSQSLTARTLGALRAQGKLQLVEGRTTIAPGVELLPTPGETPGHLAVRVESEGAIAYIIGDLIHHPVEIERPEWNVVWADTTAMRETRRWLYADALAERATLIAAHIEGAGHLVRVADGDLRWQAGMLE